jgi:ubiquinone/menaquinone biosynthesis C-methylase UbiE
MIHNRKKILEHWNKDEVESMYDKHLINAEIELIKTRIQEDSKILDAGCGEGEGTIEYSKIPGVNIHAADFSETRLRKAHARLKNCENVTLKKVDFLDEYSLDNDYDIIITQRLLINIMEWRLQCKVILDLMAMLKTGGKLMMIEGYKQGVDSLNEVRRVWGLEPIPIKWHNLFFDEDVLYEFMNKHGYKLLDHDGLGTYYLLTRGIRPMLDSKLNWNCDFNRIASSKKMKELFGFSDKFSRLKLWVFVK